MHFFLTLKNMLLTLIRIALLRGFWQVILPHIFVAKHGQLFFPWLFLLLLPVWSNKIYEAWHIITVRNIGTAKIQVRPCICAVSQDPVLFIQAVYWPRSSLRQRVRDLHPIHGSWLSMCNLVVIIELYVKHLYCEKAVIHVGMSQYERNLLLCMNVWIHACFGEGETLYL